MKPAFSQQRGGGHGLACPCCVSLRQALLRSPLIWAPSSAAPKPARAPVGSDVGERGLVSVPIKLKEEMVDRLKKEAASQGVPFEAMLTDIVDSYFLREEALAKTSYRAQESLDAVYVLEPIITLVDGLLMGEHTVAQAMTHGDTGLGTLDLLDGEVVVYQGIAYHQSADGTCHVLTGNEVTPFMTVTTWDQDKTVSFKLEQDLDYTALQSFMKKSVFRSGNVFYVMEIQGAFPTVKARAVRKQDKARKLVEVAADQAMFDFSNEEGVLVGFFSPDYMGSSINVPGFHLHYLSGDRKRGGHLLNCVIKAGATITVQEIHRIKVDLPFRKDFMDSTFDRDVSEEIEAAEKER